MARGDRAKRGRRGSATVEKETRARGPDLINQLPEECLTLIFGFLPSPRDRCSCAVVSKKWLRVQARMKHSELRSQQGGDSLPTKEISRCLDMEEANDRRLAAMAIGIRYQGVLTELSIRECLPSLAFSSRGEGITDYGLIVISKACPDLKSLTLWNCTKIGAKGIASVADCCASLEKFNLSNSPLITDDDGLPLIAKGCPNLSSLILDSCPSIGNLSLEAFAEQSSKLKLFILEKCPLVEDSAIVSILTNLRELRMLKIGSMEVGDAVLEAIGRHKQLRTLHLEKVRGITEEGYRWIGENENLQSLSLNCCRALSGKSFRQRTAHKNVFVGLKKLAIKNCRTMTDGDLVELAKSATSLNSLTLEKLDGITSRGLVAALSHCSRTLRKLSLLKCHLMGAGGQQQSDAPHPLPPNFPVLRTVMLNQCQGIGDGFLVVMGWAFKQVEEVGLVRMDSITDRGILGFLDKLGSNNNITKLDLNGCRSVTDRSLPAIARQCQELEELDLSRCRISDQGVEWLAKEEPCWLQTLSLNGCAAITDKSLEELESLCLSLESVSVVSCPRISQEAIASFRESCFCDVRS